MTTDWILRTGDGNNLIASSRYRIWGIQSTTTDNKHFLNNVRPGDRLWFIKSKSHGKIIAVATYRSYNTRLFGPLVSTLSNNELGWTNEDTNWTSDIEIHYTDLYNVSTLDLLTHIKSPKTIRKYNEKCRVELAVEYINIIR